MTGHEDACLDFAIEQRDVAIQCDFFPPELIKLAGALGLGKVGRPLFDDTCIRTPSYSNNQARVIPTSLAYFYKLLYTIISSQIKLSTGRLIYVHF